MELTSHIDLTLVLLYTFWIFFAGLVYYLHRESKREGYPLVADSAKRGRSTPMADPIGPKTFRLRTGNSVTVSGGRPDTRAVAAEPAALFPGAPLNPTGNAMADGVGPASYAMRADTPDITVDGQTKILPLRLATEFHLEPRDTNPIGLPVLGVDREVAGTIKDCWVDRSEYIMRYYEVALTDGRSVLLPANFARVTERAVKVNAIKAAQFTGVPGLRHPDQVTLLEEDKITGYYGGGYLYAWPSRTEPLL